MKSRMLKTNLCAFLIACTLAAMVSAPLVASPASALRTVPPEVMSGTVVDISLEVSGCGRFGQVIETLPEGFAYLNCNSTDIGVELIDNVVKFSFLGDSVSFTYRVKAPEITGNSSYTFHGTVLDEDRNSYPIDDDEVMVIFDENNPPVSIGLASISSNLVLVYGYRFGEGSGGWTIYNPEWANTHPSWNTLNVLELGGGYWIKVNADCQLSYGTRNTPDKPLPRYNLREGWNLIGWLGY